MPTKTRTAKRETRTAARARSGAGKPPTHGASNASRLAGAFEAVDSFPALVAAQSRVLELASAEAPAESDLIEAVESDPALVMAVLRFVNRHRAKGNARIATIPAALEKLTPRGVESLAGATQTYDFFERSKWEPQPEAFRQHAMSTRAAADRIAGTLDFGDRDELVVAALIHDVGRLVLGVLYPGYRERLDPATMTAEERSLEERRELGIDHALVGGVLARRWDLPPSIASAIERHHAEDASGLAGIVRLADMLAHHGRGNAVSPEAMTAAAANCGLDSAQLRGILYELSQPSQPRQRPSEPCPLSVRELDVLRRLSEGKVYKQIAHEVSLSTSTVRTHLHNIYAKIGAVDRAQAVLLARDRGWI